ncbi:MAG: hypothetical protein ACI9IP_001127 [Arcticibacterium sp.]|jgi:hypothetical protein
MKKILSLLIFITLLTVRNSQAQSFDLGILDNAMSMIKSGNNNNKVAAILGDAVMSLKDEVVQSQTSFAPKLLSQVTALAGLIPSIKKGNVDLTLVQKIISTVKTLVAAQRLKGLLSGGSLSGKGSEVGNNVNLLKSGMSLLGGGSSVDKLSKTLNMVGKKSGKLDKSGMFASMAQKAIGKKLGSSLNLLSGLI